MENLKKILETLNDNQPNEKRLQIAIKLTLEAFNEKIKFILDEANNSLKKDFEMKAKPVVGIVPFAEINKNDNFLKSLYGKYEYLLSKLNFDLEKCKTMLETALILEEYSKMLFFLGGFGTEKNKEKSDECTPVTTTQA